MYRQLESFTISTIQCCTFIEINSHSVVQADLKTHYVAQASCELAAIQVLGLQASATTPGLHLLNAQVIIMFLMLNFPNGIDNVDLV